MLFLKMTIKIVIFDLDGTLYDEWDYVRGGFREVATYLSSKYKIDKDKIYGNLWNHFAVNGRGKSFNFILEKLNLKDETVHNLVTIYHNHTPIIKAYEDALYVIKTLKRNYYLAMITDGDKRVQKNKLAALNLEGFFNKIVYTGTKDSENKPSTKPYLQIINSFGVKPNECLCVGDDPTKDFFGAKQLGCITVRILRGENKNKSVPASQDADILVTNFYDLRGMI